MRIFAVFPSMTRWPEELAGSFGSGPAANDNRSMLGFSSSMLPLDALAIIEPVPATAGRCGASRRSQWRIRFRRGWQSHAGLQTDWSADSDPLGVLDLRFPDRWTAERYCRRQSIPFEVRTVPARRSQNAHPGPLCRLTASHRPLCCWPTGPHALCCGRYPFLNGGAAQVAANEDARDYAC